MLSYADMVLLMAAGSVLVVFLSALVIVSLWRLRQDQQRWRETREELHRMERSELQSYRERLESVERRIDRVIPVAKIEVIGGREIGVHDEAEGT